MSYSFNVVAATKGEALTKAAQEFDKVVAGQPIHAKDQKAALANVVNVLDVLPDDPTKQISVSVSGYVSWIVGDIITQASVSVIASIV